MDDAGEAVFSFSSTNHAIQAEHCLLAAALAVRVMPLPSAIKAGCGICLRLPRGQREAALSLLREAGIPPQHVHMRTVKHSTSTHAGTHASIYSEWKEGEET